MAAFEKAKAKRSSYLGRLEVFRAAVNGIDLEKTDEFTNAILEEHMDRNIHLGTEFWTIQNKIIDMGASDDDIQVGSTFENNFINTVAKAKQLLKILNTDKAGNKSIILDTSMNSNLDDLIDNKKYPSIPLPEYSGEEEKWLSFKEQYVDQIHSPKNTIGNLRKHYYLRMCLKGEAKLLIEQVALTADNYEIAWNLLCDRYDNVIKLTFKHIKQILHFPNQDSKPGYFRRLLDTIKLNKHALITLKQPVNKWDAILLCTCLEKLDKATITSWEEYKQNNEIDLNEFLDFLKQKAEIADSVKSCPSVKTTKISCPVLNSNNSSCPVCKQQHFIYNCAQFLNLNIEKRIEKAAELKLCKNCLRSGHKTVECYSSFTCRTCHKKHNTLLHKVVTTSQISDNQTATTSNVHVFAGTVRPDKHDNHHDSTCLLSTAIVEVISPHGKSIQCKALLDSGSQCHLITKNLVNQLNIETYQSEVSITGINQKVSNLSETTTIKIQSLNSSYQKTIQCNVIPIITGKIPDSYTEPLSWQLPPYIKLADPKYNSPSHIDLLIGGQLFWELIKPNNKTIANYKIKLQDTHLGWLITGLLPTLHSNKICCVVQNSFTELNKNIKRFWEIEEVNVKPVPSIEEEQCENIFQSTYSREANTGKFVVSIPFKLSTANLGNSRTIAEKRFLALEKRLSKDKALRELYVKFMREYSNLGHMTKIITSDDVDNTYYFPHHGVLRDNALTTKLRVVFNGSAPSDNNVCLNDLQYKGAQLQDDLFDLLVRFRLFTYVVSGDITMMYRQIQIIPEQRRFQRIFWREAPTDILEAYELNTVTYGTTSAPFLAKRVLKEIGLNVQESHPIESSMIINDFYMDDLLTGLNDKTQLTASVSKISKVLKSAGFEIRKWATNEQTIIDQFPMDTKLKHYREFGKTEPTKTLGLQWNSESDSLHYRISPLQKY